MSEHNDDDHPIRGVGWTIETLRAYLIAEMRAADRRLIAEMHASDRRYEQRFADQQTAILKAEESTEKRFASVNELRGALDDAAKLLMPRSESNARYDSLMRQIEEHVKQDGTNHAGLANRIDQLSSRMDRWQGAQEGTKDTKGDSRATWAMVIAISAVVVEVLIQLSKMRVG